MLIVVIVVIVVTVVGRTRLSEVDALKIISLVVTQSALLSAQAVTDKMGIILSDICMHQGCSHPGVLQILALEGTGIGR